MELTKYDVGFPVEVSSLDELYLHLLRERAPEAIRQVDSERDYLLALYGGPPYRSLTSGGSVTVNRYRQLVFAVVFVIGATKQTNPLSWDPLVNLEYPRVVVTLGRPKFYSVWLAGAYDVVGQFATAEGAIAWGSLAHATGRRV